MNTAQIEFYIRVRNATERTGGKLLVKMLRRALQRYGNAVLSKAEKK